MTISQTNPEQLRPREDDKSGPIIRVDAGRRHEAIERLVSTGRQTDRAAVERFLHYAAMKRPHLRSARTSSLPASSAALIRKKPSA